MMPQLYAFKFELKGTSFAAEVRFPAALQYLHLTIEFKLEQRLTATQCYTALERLVDGAMSRIRDELYAQRWPAASARGLLVRHRGVSNLVLTFPSQSAVARLTRTVELEATQHPQPHRFLDHYAHSRQ
jgi:DNA topoisomerase IB